MTRMSRIRPCAMFALVAVIAAIGPAACGGDGKQAKEPVAADDADDEPAPADDGDELIPPEKLDSIQRAFDRKRALVGRCFVDAIDAGEIERGAKGFTTVYTRITASGKPTGTKIVKASHESKVLWDCVIGYVSKWKFTSLPKALDYTYTFAFDTL